MHQARELSGRHAWRSADDADGETLRPREAEHGRHALGDLVQRVVDGPHQLHETKRGIQFGIGHGGTPIIRNR